MAEELAKPTSVRLTLTKKHLNRPEIQDFVALLVGIASDGVVEYEELQRLTTWLNSNVNSDVPAVRYMVNLMLRVCSDGELGQEEIFEIQLAIERVLPKEQRARIAETRKAIYYDQPASANQLDLIEELTFRRPEGLTRRAASEMIDEFFSNPPPTNRQLMVLRFWNRLDLSGCSRREISDWMDAFLNEDYNRWGAWELYKKESGDDGLQNDPEVVPIGVGESYLARVRRGE